MSIRGLKRMALLLTFWLATQCCRLNAQTITGNVVTNNLTVTGSNVYMGTQTSTTNPGWGTIYTDGTNSTVEFEGTRSGNTWEWLEDNGSILQMTLDTTDTLKLYNSSGTNEITLSPTGTSSFASSVIISGTNNTMTNQTLTGSGSVLTEGLADSRYLSSSNITTGSGTYMGTPGPIIGLNGATATGAYTFAEGDGSTAADLASTALGASSASSLYSTAMGQSTANSKWSTAMGKSTAINWYSTAMGDSSSSSRYSTAMGESGASSWWSTAMGLSTASNYYSTAMGNSIANSKWSTAMGQSTASSKWSTAMGKSTASGYYSTAAGDKTTAKAYDSFALGRYNVGAGTTNSWVTTDPLFEIGNGTSTTNTADALIVYKNGNAVIQGTLTTDGAISTTNTISTSNLSASGTISVSGAITSSGTISALGSTGTNIFLGSVIISGTNNTMTNQTLTGSGSVLTEGLADSRYASSSSVSSLNSAVSPLTSSIAIGSGSGYAPWWRTSISGPTIVINGQSVGSASGAYSFAEGVSTASGNYSVAMGNWNTASGGYSVAMGNWTLANGWVSTAFGRNTTASGNYSTASGYHTTASGNYSMAMGEFSTASGYYSTVMGEGSVASGEGSTAMGIVTSANAFGSFVVGQANVGLNANGETASTNSWVATDPLFEIGNGTTSSSYVYNNTLHMGRYISLPATRSDAFVVYKNGNAAVQGSLSAGGPISSSVSITTSGTISAASLTASSNVTAPSFITTTQTGDIPMYTGN